jgi:hypothetical protein
MIMMLLTNAGVGLLLALVSLPLINNKVKPNYFYGYRNRRTLSNPEIWYAANHYAGTQLFAAGICVTILSVLLYFITGRNYNLYVLVAPLALIIVVTIAVIRSAVYLHSLDDSGKSNNDEE